MNELHFAYKIRQQLNRSTHELSPETLDRLARARNAALTVQKQAVRQPMLAGAGALFAFGMGGLHVKQGLLACALLASFVFSTFWMADQRVNELGAIDSALLSSDLPIAAFTDKGFSTWLRSNSLE